MANPATVTAMTSRGALVRDDNAFPVGWLSSHIATQTTTNVKTTPGILHSITINTPLATGTITVYDANAGTSNAIAIIVTPTAGQPETLFYDVVCNNGITVVTGVATQDITIAYI